MKIKHIALTLFAALSVSASATTVTAGGGTAGALFFTSAGTGLTSTNSSFSAGLWNGSIFTAFAATDVTPIAISTVASLANRWSAGFTDNNNTTSSPFNGQTIWFRVTTTADGGGVAYFSGASVFPNANGGVADSATVDSRTLLTLGAGSTEGSAAYNSGTNRITIGVVPEPSTALLGLLGVAGLIRRRR
jgi:PEP-CTERM motif